jgi:hypothetical protein
MTRNYIPQASCASNNPADYFNDLNNLLLNLFLDPRPGGSMTQATFTQAVFYANKAALTRAAATEKYCRTLLIDAGAEAEIPQIYPAALGILSVIIALHLAGLIALAYYASKQPTWTETLDAFAMLKLGLELPVSRQPAEGPARDSSTASVVA